MGLHLDITSVWLIPPYTTLLYCKTGVYRGIHFFSFLLLNRDYINPKDSRPTVGRFIGRSSADLSADKMPDFSSFFIGRQKINYNYLVIIIFPSADSFGVLAIGR